MKFIKKILKKVIHWIVSVEEEPIRENNSYNSYNTLSKSPGKYATSKTGDSIDHAGGLNFSVYSAIGGKVIQLRTYNSTTDTTKSTLYVVTDKEELGQELAHIITIESLSR